MPLIKQTRERVFKIDLRPHTGLSLSPRQLEQLNHRHGIRRDWNWRERLFLWPLRGRVHEMTMTITADARAFQRGLDALSNVLERRIDRE